jgi:hypothetical protein
MTVLTLEKRKPTTEPASVYLHGAVTRAADFRHELPHMSDEVCVKEAIHTITDMRDLIVAAMEKME